MQQNPVPAGTVRQKQKVSVTNWDVLYSEKEWLQFLQTHRAEYPEKHILNISVGADDVFDLI